jgi:hypothetical protein
VPYLPRSRGAPGAPVAASSSFPSASLSWGRCIWRDRQVDRRSPRSPRFIGPALTARGEPPSIDGCRAPSTHLVHRRSDRSADRRPVGRSGNRVWRRPGRMRPVLVHVLAHAAARVRGIARGRHAAAVPGPRGGRPTTGAARLSGRGSGRLAPSRSARRCAGLEWRASAHGAYGRGSSRRPAGVGHLLLRDEGGLPPARDRDGASRRGCRLGQPKRRTGARRLPGRGQRQPSAHLALSRGRVDLPPSRLS